MSITITLTVSCDDPGAIKTAQMRDAIEDAANAAIGRAFPGIDQGTASALVEIAVVRVRGKQAATAGSN
jgi:hypothetical protein